MLALPAPNQSGVSVPALNTTPIDPITKAPIGRIVVDGNGNAVIEPVGGSTVARSNGIDTHTLYANGSNRYRLNPRDMRTIHVRMVMLMRLEAGPTSEGKEHPWTLMGMLFHQIVRLLIFH